MKAFFIRQLASNQASHPRHSPLVEHLMTIDLDKLEALAKAATPGPWRGDRIDGTVKYDIVAGDYPHGKYEIVCRGDNGNNFGFMKAEDEDYALAANPTAILELIAEVRALREDKERLDSGCIITTDYDEFGDKTKTERRGNNLRQMIDEAMARAKEKA
ncbi:hypothetical protein QF001_000906 [Paraburkholderia youngii]|uniref:hypothetical protein n=1 Tax=Paraburkholderia youngii TaxID=2782701 RepID=UPI003D211D4C